MVVVPLAGSSVERLTEAVVNGVEVTEMGGKDVESVPGREVWMVTKLSVDSVIGSSVSMDDEPTVGSTIREDSAVVPPGKVGVADGSSKVVSTGCVNDVAPCADT